MQMRKKRNFFISQNKGFSLIEMIVYVAVFSVSAVFLVGILTVVTQVQVREASIYEVTQQISFVKDTVERLVQRSSLVDIEPGGATSTLKLRMSSSSIDTTLVYASSSILYLEERDESGSATVSPITDSNVTVDTFSVTKYENPGGFAVVQIDLTLTASSTKPSAQITKSLRTGISRISAAEFDSSVYPNADNSIDLGTSLKTWKDAYISGNLGVGVTSFSSGYKLTVSGGDIGVRDAGDGVVLKTPDGGSCYRISITNSGAVTSTLVVTCP